MPSPSACPSEINNSETPPSPPVQVEVAVRAPPIHEHTKLAGKAGAHIVLQVAHKVPAVKQDVLGKGCKEVAGGAGVGGGPCSLTIGSQHLAAAPFLSMSRPSLPALTVDQAPVAIRIRGLVVLVPTGYQCSRSAGSHVARALPATRNETLHQPTASSCGGAHLLPALT